MSEGHDWTKRSGQFKGKGSEMTTHVRRQQTMSVRKADRHAKVATRRLMPSSASEDVDDAADPAVAAAAVRDRARAAVAVLLSPPSEAELLAAVRSLCGALSHETYPPMGAVVAAGAVGVLAQLLASPNDALQLEALRCLTNVAAEGEAHARAVLVALPALVALAAGGHPGLAEQSCWVLGNLAAESDGLRGAVIAAGAVAPLSATMTAACAPGPAAAAAAAALPSSRLCTTAWALGNLMRPGAAPLSCFMAADAGPTGCALPTALLALLGHPEAVVGGEAAWALSFLTARPDDTAHAALLALGGAAALANALARAAAANPLATPVLRVIGNIVSVGEAAAEGMLAAPDFLPSLAGIFAANAAAPAAGFGGSGTGEAGVPRGLVKEACWVASNLLVGPPRHRALVLAKPTEGGADLLPSLAAALTGGGGFDLEREALFAVAAAAGPRPFDAPVARRALYELGCLGPAVRFVTAGDSGAAGAALDLVEAALRCGEPGGARAVEAAGGLEALDELHYSGTCAEHLQARAAGLVDEFFGDEYGASDDDDDDAGGGGGGGGGSGSGCSGFPAPHPGSFGFGFTPPPGVVAGALAGPAAGAGGVGLPPAGRGRGMTLPSWMTAATPPP